ncbi:carboxylesterase/lipase family protein [Pontibacter sp. SGAir0037]|uniref:carboxylesterase/lipase family protein n=1 Tax=Pontibacter sp. SGAir0037 TaxID=2571030 RepID=UPI0010CCC1F5|nr:carboxylesterase family protein [Pontibacter sp. SGAir0037]QCR23911.1 esterase [Pontibacter sp. SGAir0037]
MRSLRSIILLIACTLGLAAFIYRAPGLDVVKTKAGLVEGVRNQAGDLVSFKGIPFAAPPVGDLRWKAPQPVKPWTGVRKADVFGPSPMQPEPAPFSMWSAEFLIPKEPISEDCLYLNVWTGAQSADEKRPVLVWIYGGGFNSGGSAVPIYDGEAMAQKGIVFVSLNYRVGPFGFLAHPALTEESGRNASGNYGLMDQVAGLQWVKENIAAFGGDPNNVTIAGQSAGSMSVNALVASPLAKGLFRKAIAQSGANFSRGSATLQQAEAEGVKLAQSLNAASLDELRKVPAKELLQKAQGMRGPVIDGYVLPNTIAAIFAAGEQNKVDLLTGWNEDEGLLFGPIQSAGEFRKQAAEQYGADAKTFLSFYPASTDAEAAASQLNLSRDMIFDVQNYTWANVQSEQEKNKVYVYRFTRDVPATGEYVKYGAFHTGEVPYAYDNLKFVVRPWEPLDHALAKTMSAYWANFIRTGNPNSKDLPQWPAYNKGKKQIMTFGKKAEAKPLPDGAALDFLHSKMSSR